jgi:translation initiation factor IF-2
MYWLGGTMAEDEIGHITHFFPKISVAVIEVTAGPLKVGDTIRIKGHTSDFTQTVESLQQEHLQVPELKKGASAGIKVKEHVREGDKVYRVAPAS